jgi:hypothetical protein
MRALVLGVVLAACSSKRQEPPPPAPPVTNDAESAAPFVPDRVLSSFGNANSVFAINFDALRIVAKHPMFVDLPCARELLTTAGVGVFALGDTMQGYMSNMPPAATKTCIAILAPRFGAHPDDKAASYTLVGGGGGRYALRWTGMTLHIEELAARGPSGKLPSTMWARAKQLPRDAAFWMISQDLMQYGPGRVWARVTTEAMEWSVELEGKPDVLRPHLEEARQGIQDYYTQLGMTLEDGIADITVSPESSKLGGAVPLSVLLESNRRRSEELRQSPQSTTRSSSGQEQ